MICKWLKNDIFIKKARQFSSLAQLLKQNKASDLMSILASYMIHVQWKDHNQHV